MSHAYKKLASLVRAWEEIADGKAMATEHKAHRSHNPAISNFLPGSYERSERSRISHSASKNKLHCLLCTTLVTNIRGAVNGNHTILNEVLNSTCRASGFLENWCENLLRKDRIRLRESKLESYSSIAVPDVCYGLGHCSRRLRNDMRIKNSYPVVKSDNSSAKENLNCMLCFGLTTTAAVHSSKNETERVFYLERYCNGTILFTGHCNDIKVKNMDRILEAKEDRDARAICNRLHLCSQRHLSQLQEYSEGNTIASVPMSFYRGGARTQIVDTSMFGPITPMDVMDLEVRAPEDFDRFWPATIDEKLQWLARYGLIANSVTCPSNACGQNSPMTLVADKDSIDQFVWRCPVCKRTQQITKVSVRHGTFFEKAHLSFDQIIRLMVIWATRPKLSYNEIRTSLGTNRHGQLIGRETLVDYYNFFREVCTVWCEEHAGIRQLGGPGIVVEIDESLVYHNKYHRGRQRTQGWVFGMVERGTPNVVLVPLIPPMRRDAATLLPLIQDWIKPGSFVMSDMWRAYTRINQLPQGYIHLWVNHRIRFVGLAIPGAPPIHTQTIENQWKHLKESMRHLSGTTQDLYPSYLTQYMFRKAHNGEKIFQNLVYWISHQFPV